MDYRDGPPPQSLDPTPFSSGTPVIVRVCGYKENWEGTLLRSNNTWVVVSLNVPWTITEIAIPLREIEFIMRKV